MDKITIVLPANDSDAAIRILNDLLDKKTLVLGIIVGDENWYNRLIEDVESAALSREVSRRAVWIKNPEPVSDILQTLFGNSEDFNFPKQKSFFFTVSLSQKVCDLILPGEPNLDLYRIDDAYLSAEKG